MHELSRAIPAGAGRHSELLLDDDALDRVLRDGPRALVE